jgi:hypothetical protein
MTVAINLSQNFAIDEYNRDRILDWSESDALMKLMPVTYKDTSLVIWEQRDNNFGLMPLRGLNGAPEVTTFPDAKRFGVEPGYFGAKIILDEKQLTKLREIGTPNETVDADKLIAEVNLQMLSQAFDRLRQMTADLCTTGKVRVQSASGAIYYYEMNGFNSVVPVTDWSNPSLGKPISDLRTARVNLELGTSARYGPDSTLLANPVTINHMLQTDEVKAVIRGQYGSTEKGLEGLNRILAGYNLPQIEEYSENYFASQTASQTRTSATRFLADRKLIWVATRKDGAPAGQFTMTRNTRRNPPMGLGGDSADRVVNEGLDLLPNDIARGFFHQVQYDTDNGSLVAQCGFNGGHAVQYPTSIAGLAY